MRLRSGAVTRTQCGSDFGVGFNTEKGRGRGFPLPPYTSEVN